MKTERSTELVLPGTDHRHRNRTRQRHKLTVLALLALLAVLALLATGCGKQIPPYWPDMVIDQDTLYVAEMNGQVFALQADTGDVVWSYPLIERQQGGLLSGCSAPTPTDGPFFAAPAVGQEYVFLGSAGELQNSLWGKSENNSGLRVLNKLGTLQWEFKGANDRTVAPPALTETTIYLPSSDYKVYAIDLNTRDARWVFETQNWVWATPLIVQDRVYIASMDHSLYAVDDATGNQVWRFDKPQSALPAAPAYAKDTLYFGSLDGYVYAVDAQTGTLRWEQKVDGGVWATPLIVDEQLYFGTLGGQIYALAVTDGTPIWTASVEGEVRGTPAYASGTLYFGCENGQLYAFESGDGAQTISPLGTELDKASIYTSPVLGSQYLYVVATDGQVYALDVERNAVVWQTNPLTEDQEEK